MATFLLTASQKTDDGDRLASADGLGSAVLVHNVRWFIWVRWIVVAVLLLAGLVSNFAPAIVTGLGLIPPRRWPWIMAVGLTAANIVFWMLTRHLTDKSPDKTVKGNMWLQIAVDLAVVTILVHCVGSTSTFVSFTYLFHVVLACIFFSPARSLLVTLTAAGLYLLCVGLELLEIWPAAGMVPLYASHVVAGRKLAVISAVSAVFVWLVVWYLVAALAKIVRERGRLLEAANQRLLAADQEKNRIMLRTTHDLKAPFSGMESNIQVLKLQYWDQIPDSVKDIVQRIEARAQTLSDRIKDILLLGDLRTRMEPAAAPETMDLGQVLQEVVEELEDKARERRIAIRLQPKPLRVAGAARHFAVLFSNLIANAISYSREGSIVEVSVDLDDKDVHVLVRDAGIGIAEKSLPYIFDEYFRTKEAARFNPGSTGLGLAIVKEIVQKEGLKIAVTSEVGKGTTFDVAIPVSRCEFSKEAYPNLKVTP